MAATHTTQISVDPVHLVAMAVPGAIGGDLLAPGQTKDILVGGLISALASDFVKVNDAPLHRHMRYLFQTVPLLGAGAGYGLARLGKMSPEQSLVPAVLGALILPYIYNYTGVAGVKPQGSSDVTAYEAIDSDGGPPRVPGNIFPLM